MGEEKGGGWDGRRPGETLELDKSRRKFAEDEPDRETVRGEVEKAFPYPEGVDVMRLMKWDGVMGCWTIVMRGIFVGIETDGYIHS